MGVSEGFYFFQKKSLIFGESLKDYPTSIDSISLYLNASKDKTFSVTALQREIAEKTHAENASAFDYIQLGRTFSDAYQEEISFQLYYIAYLKDSNLINTNSELQLE